jgi:general secretion pathway protein D
MINPHPLTAMPPRLHGLVLCLALTLPLPVGSQPATASPANPSSVMAQGPHKVQLNFSNADIEAVTRTLMALAKPNHTLVMDPKVKGTLTLQTERAVTHEQAWTLLLTALRLRNYAVTVTAQVVKVVPEMEAKWQGSSPAVFQGMAAPRDGQVATRIFNLTHESAANLVPVLRPLISANNTINVNPGTNTLVITDYSDNLARLARIIESLDQPRAVEPVVVPLKHALAIDVVNLVSKLLGEAAPRGPASAGQVDNSLRTTVLADARSNAVVIRAPNSAQLAQAQLLVRQLDQPNGLSGSGQLHVVYLKNANAQQLATTLRAALASAGTATANPGSAPPPSGGSPASQTGGQIQADLATNSLIITAPEPVYRDLLAVIQKLDQRRAQVLVESIIAEVDASKAAQFGIQWQGVNGQNGSAVGILGTNFGTGGNNLLNLSTQGATGGALPGPGLNIATARPINGTYVLGALANFLQTQGGANILSTPSLLTLDNEEAKIVVGQNVPFVTGQYTANNTNAGAVNPFQTIERKDVGLTLKVKPQISESGAVKLNIYQEVSSVNAANSANGLVTNKRSIESNVLVQDGAVVVLGGLLSDSFESNASQVPGLGDLPVLGALFRSESRNRQKTNLMVFLRPVVLRDEASTSTLSQQRYREMYDSQRGSHQPGTPTLPVPNDAALPPPVLAPRAVPGQP